MSRPCRYASSASIGASLSLSIGASLSLSGSAWSCGDPRRQQCAVSTSMSAMRGGLPSSYRFTTTLLGLVSMHRTTRLARVYRSTSIDSPSASLNIFRMSAGHFCTSESE